MGVGYQGLQFALLAKRRDVDFSQTVMLGRQNHYLHPKALADLFPRFGVSLSEADVNTILETDYSEGLFRHLGANVIDSMDASSYENATIIHDMNQPLPADLVGKYGCVVDYGTLEHVFNFPVAIKNATDLLRDGGSFISITPCNNMMGHGFYQFSPELFYNYLSSNGFVDIEVYMILYRDFPYFFKVTDPREFRGRIELVNNEAVQIGVIARKEKSVPQVAPIQSDYANEFWQGRDVNRRFSTDTTAKPSPVAWFVGGVKRRAVRWFRARLPAVIRLPERLSPQFVNGFENRLQYQLIDPAQD